MWTAAFWSYNQLFAQYVQTCQDEVSTKARWKAMRSNKTDQLAHLAIFHMRYQSGRTTIHILIEPVSRPLFIELFDRVVLISETDSHAVREAHHAVRAVTHHGSCTLMTNRRASNSCLPSQLEQHYIGQLPAVGPSLFPPSSPLPRTLPLPPSFPFLSSPSPLTPSSSPTRCRLPTPPCIGVR